MLGRGAPQPAFRYQFPQDFNREDTVNVRARVAVVVVIVGDCQLLRHRLRRNRTITGVPLQHKGLLALEVDARRADNPHAAAVELA